ncbi:DUF4145 domain-containing protein [Candidatus Oscillochloris fontis]|uniref:DUF4145 domain-containing protein n=1 Tax=Candidatus Oscillochloris fontis TaxID=2496868 RepID=UPI00193103AE|nr:DUF4145 domain-containing protein [Candidatus Oscillochloris fontis]
MNCPYCGILFSLDGVNADHSFPKFSSFHPYRRVPSKSDNTTTDDLAKKYSITSHRCPDCKKPIMWLNEIEGDLGAEERKIISTTLLFPKFPVKQIPIEIPEKFAVDFREAHDTLSVSAKASAALSRRCLQNLIREQEGITEKTLFSEVDKLIKSNKLPKHLAKDLDSIRQIGNFAAHPMKDTNTGEIVEVELGEAEWTLEVLETLLLFYFVEEPKSSARRDALNKKLKEYGKGPML